MHYNALMVEARNLEPTAQNRHAEYLRALGEHVRNWRARRGITRKQLAQHSGVSERYLAQVETGHGNVSIALLRQIAQAMGVPLVDLVREGPERPVELTLLEHRLGRLAPDELTEAYRLIAGSPGARRERHGRIALIGLRGAGKTTLGRQLAKRLKIPFIRLDEIIEQEAGIALGEIFSLWDQAGYRRLERRALERVIENNARGVIETGGSLVSEPGTYDLLLDTCFTVWIKASPEEHMVRVAAQGDYRPMADNAEAMDDLRRILANRQALYLRADAQIDTSGAKLEDSLDALVKTVNAK